MQDEISNFLKDLRDRAGNIFITSIILGFISRYRVELFELFKLDDNKTYATNLNLLKLVDCELWKIILSILFLYTISIIMGRVLLAGKTFIINKTDSFFGKFIPLPEADRKSYEALIDKNKKTIEELNNILGSFILKSYGELTQIYKYFNQTFYRIELSILNNLDENKFIFIYDMKEEKMIDKDLFLPLGENEKRFIRVFSLNSKRGICFKLELDKEKIKWGDNYTEQINFGSENLYTGIPTINSDKPLFIDSSGKILDSAKKPFLNLSKDKQHNNLILIYRGP